LQNLNNHLLELSETLDQSIFTQANQFFFIYRIQSKFIKLPMCLFFLMALGLNDFDAGNIHTKGNWKGWALKIETYWKGCALKIETFLGPEMATSKASAIWATKARFSGPISNGPSNGFSRIKIIKSKRHLYGSTKLGTATYSMIP
jgi:hypothetical protein